MKVSSINATPEHILEHVKAQRSFLYFAQHILGYKKNDSDYYDLTETHLKLCDLLEKSKKPKLILMPRHSIKSHLITIGWALWRLVKNPNLRILIYSDSATKAEGFLYGIKCHIEGKSVGSRFRDFYPEWESDPHQGGTYNESKIVIRARKHAQKEPSVDTGGVEASKIGMHYDIIIFDDIVSDINTTTKAQMDKVHDCYKKSLSLLKPGGDIVLVGTRWHFGDAYGRIIEENKYTNEFDIFIKDAEEEVDGKLLFESIGLDRAFLDKQRASQGSYFYSSLYRNNPVDDETALFRVDNFNYYDPSTFSSKDLFITGSCDPAGEGEDYTAIVICGTDSNNNMYVLDAVNRHLKPNEIIDEIIRLNYKWRFDRFSTEKNFFRGMLEREFRKAEEEHRKNKNYKMFSFKEDLTASSKNSNHVRVLRLQPLQEQKKLYFPGKNFNTLDRVYNELAFQMIQYTSSGSKSPHDDLVKALSFHLEISAKGGMPKEKEVPYSSAAWFEERYIETLSRSKVPSRYNQQYEPAFLK